MNEINELFNLDWHGFVYTLFLIMASIIAIFKIVDEFIKLIRKLRHLPNPKNDEQDKEIEAIKSRQDNLEQSLNLIKENVMVATWDRIVHFGMNYVTRGHISYAEKDIFLAQSKTYKRCGGNGHLIGFIPHVENLPYTEDLTEEEIEVIEMDEIAKRKRVASAKASLSAYYGK